MRREFTRAVLVVFALMFGAWGCTSQPAVPRAHTIKGIGALPWRDIESGLSSEQWSEIARWEYEAYLVLDTTVNSDGRLKLTRVQESFPDASWNRFADVGLDHARLRPALAGSHLVPRAELYIVFFKPVKDGRMALIYARISGSDPMQTEIPMEPLEGRRKAEMHTSNTYFNILALAEIRSAH